MGTLQTAQLPTTYQTTHSELECLRSRYELKFRTRASCLGTRHLDRGGSEMAETKFRARASCLVPVVVPRHHQTLGWSAFKSTEMFQRLIPSLSMYDVSTINSF